MAGFAVALLLLALSGAFLWRVVGAGDVLLPGRFLAHIEPWRSEAAIVDEPASSWNALQWDALAQYYPWRLFAHRELGRGVIPLWNPHQFCGTPFLANAQSAIFYPLNLIFWVIDPARAFGFAAWLHLWLAGCFTFLFLRALRLGRFGALFGAIAFAFGGSLVTWLELPTLVNVWVWLPLILYLIERYFQTSRLGFAGAAGIAFAVAVLAGHPQVSLYLALAVLSFYVFRAVAAGRADRHWRRRVFVGAAVAAGIAICLTAVQLLPTAEFIGFSHRARATGLAGYADYRKFAMPWQHLVTLFLPDFFGNPTLGTYWGAANYAELCGYVGILPLLFAVAAVALRRDRYAWAFAVGAAFSLLVALGTPLDAVLFFGVPGFSRSGGPARMLFLFTACMAFLAGMGADAVARALRPDAPSPDTRRLRALAYLGGGVLIVTAGLTLGVWQSTEQMRAQSLGGVFENAWQNAFVLLVVLLVAGAGLIGAARRQLSLGMAQGLLLLLLVFDLFLFGIDYNPTAPRSAIYPVTPTIRYLQQHAGSERIMPLYSHWGLRKFPEAILPPNAATVYGLYDVQGYDSIYLAGYRQLLAQVEGHDPSPEANGNMLLADDSLFPRQLSTWAPRFSALGVRWIISDHLRVLISPSWPPRWFILWRADGGWLQIPFEDASTPVETLPDPGVLTSTGRPGPDSVWCPGWRAYADGREVASPPLKGIFRSTASEKTTSPVWRYEPTSFRLGLFLFLGGLGILAGWVAGARRGAAGKPVAGREFPA
jgi:hypothetical protein